MSEPDPAAHGDPARAPYVPSFTFDVEAARLDAARLDAARRAARASAVPVRPTRAPGAPRGGGWRLHRGPGARAA